MEVSNNVIVRNGNCGFATWTETVHGRLTNNIITSNGWRDEWVCPQVGIWMNADPENFPVSFNNVWGNEKGNYKEMQDATDKNGNLSIDPSFKGERDFHLPIKSHLRDAGDPTLTDPDGTRSDIGLYGGPTAQFNNN